jgi:drug/metabolite transporter (DMT)-like permease
VSATSHRLLPLGLLLVLGTMWGGTFSFAKLATENGVPPIGLAFWQVLGPGLTLAAICRARGLRVPLGRRHVVYYLVTGQLGISLPNILYFHLAPLIPAGVMATVVTTAPLITYLAALAIGLERFLWLRAAGLALGFGGALCLVLPEASLPDPGMAPWVALAFLTPLCYGLNGVYAGAKRPPDVGSLPLACGMLWGALLLQAPLTLATGSFYVPGTDLGPGDLGLLGQVAVSSVAYVLVFEILRLAGAVFYGQVGFVVTLTGLLWGMAIFGETHSGWIWLAVVLVLSGIAVVNLTRRWARPAA